MEIKLTPDEILDMASRSEKKDLFELLKDDFMPDIEDLVDEASSQEKRTIFESLLDEGYGNDFITEDDFPITIQDKRYMMDKEDEAMLNYLIEKYKYFF